MGEALELLRFMALSAAVHADAVQCLIDDTSSASSQMEADLERLEALEEQLSTHREEQQRLHAMRDLVNRSKADRSGFSGLVVGSSSSSSSRCRSIEKSEKKHGSCHAEHMSPAAPFSSMERVLRFASSAVEEEDIRPGSSKSSVKTGVAGVALGRNVEDDEGTTRRAPNIDEEVERLRGELRSQESMSMKAKLRGLETLKQQVKNIDANAIVARYVEPFRFSREVEELWSGKTVLRSSNIDLFIARGCQRLSGRYEDALNAIRDFPMSENSDAARVFGSLRYAKALTSANNYDAAVVQALQGFGKASLVQHYRKNRRMATVSSLLRRRRVDTVLGPNEFSFLPKDWGSAQVLLTPESIHLPPARHILTARFSFADARELKALQTLRVDFQRELLDAFIRMPKVLEEAWWHTQSRAPEDADEQDASVSVVRVLAGATGVGSGVWTTVAGCASVT